MKQTVRLLTALSVACAAIAVTVFVGCEHDDTADAIEAAVEGTDFESLDPRDNFSTNLVISPDEVELEIGQSIVFSRSGGLAPVKWSVANDSHGSVEVRGSSQAIYTHVGPGNNDVIVREAGGHQAIAHVETVIDSLLVIEPTEVTLTVDEELEVFVASGGSPPYSWKEGDSATGSLTESSGSSVTYSRTRAGDNVLTVTDSKGNTAQALIKQP